MAAPKRNEIPQWLINAILVTVLILFAVNNIARFLVQDYQPSVVIDGMMATVIGLLAMQRKSNDNGEGSE